MDCGDSWCMERALNLLSPSCTLVISLKGRDNSHTWQNLQLLPPNSFHDVFHKSKNMGLKERKRGGRERETKLIKTLECQCISMQREIKQWVFLKGKGKKKEGEGQKYEVYWSGFSREVSTNRNVYRDRYWFILRNWLMRFWRHS